MWQNIDLASAVAIVHMLCASKQVRLEFDMFMCTHVVKSNVHMWHVLCMHESHMHAHAMSRMCACVHT